MIRDYLLWDVRALSQCLLKQRLHVIVPCLSQDFCFLGHNSRQNLAFNRCVTALFLKLNVKGNFVSLLLMNCEAEVVVSVEIVERVNDQLLAQLMLFHVLEVRV